MADGSTKPIEDVAIGDEVLTTDPETGSTSSHEVVDLITGEGEKQLVDIRVRTPDGVRAMVATAGHPFWVDDEGAWITADNLRHGDELSSPDGSESEVVAVHPQTMFVRVHNLSVDGVHTYYVLAGDDPVLVHNATRGPKPWPTGTHNQTIQERVDQLKSEGYTNIKYQGENRESVIPTPGGAKSTRRPDITATDPNGNPYYEQVGRTNASGGPVSREVSAMDDIEGQTGTRPKFTPYC